MREANAEISRDNAEGLFVTVLAGILDTRTGLLEYCNAGHEPPYLCCRAATGPSCASRTAAGRRSARSIAFPTRRARAVWTPGDTHLPRHGRRDSRRHERRRPSLYGRSRFEALLDEDGHADERRRRR